MKKNIVSCIALHNLELEVNLGWSEIERGEKQTVSIDLKIQFLHPPQACQTDDLKDTLCYNNLSKVIKEHVSEKPVCLLEYLGCEIYQITKQVVKEEAFVLIRVTKKTPIKNLRDGASFYYGDEECI